MSQRGLPPRRVRLPLEAAMAFGLWCWMGAPVSADAAWLGLGAALLAAGTGEILRALGVSKFYPHFQVVGRGLPELIGEVFRDTALLLKTLVLRAYGSAPGGRFRTIPFEAGSNDSRSETRRALALMLTTLSPNALAIGVDRERNLFLYHELAPSGPPRGATGMAHP